MIASTSWKNPSSIMCRTKLCLCRQTPLDQFQHFCGTPPRSCLIQLNIKRSQTFKSRIQLRHFFCSQLTQYGFLETKQIKQIRVQVCMYTYPVTGLQIQQTVLEFVSKTHQLVAIPLTLNKPQNPYEITLFLSFIALSNLFSRIGVLLLIQKHEFF